MRWAAILVVGAMAWGPATAAEKDLAARLRESAAPAGGQVGIAVVHVESGELTAVNGRAPLPLFSVFKTPVAIAVLKEVEAGRLKLDQKIHVKPEEAAPGAPANTARWAKPVDVTIHELLDVMTVHSDNTAVDKLLPLVGGPAKVTALMAKLGFPGIQVKSSVRETSGKKGPYPNVAPAEDLARLLAAVEKGDVLKPAERGVLLESMMNAVTGVRRIRGALPEGTLVGDKTGTGPRTTNDIGIVTLPGDRGHLALAVLLTDSKLPLEEQEKVIAEIARAAYDAHVPAPAPPLHPGHLR
jgi:beta-lactamase class A